MLAHLSASRGVRASELARHLGIGAPSVSATLKRLVDAGLVTRRSDTVDRRAATLWLSQAGAKVMQASSVLDARRVALMLGRLEAADRRRALQGLALLASAALQVPKEDV